jgi:hypothetical protein
MYRSPGNSLILNNSVVAANRLSVPDCWTPSGFSGRIVSTNSIFDDATCAVSGAGNITGDPKLGSYGFNGGLTPTLLPLVGSPVINAGDDLSCLPTDQRGYSRVGVCDIGSVEYQ